MKKYLLTLLIFGAVETLSSQVLLSEDFQVFANGGELNIFVDPDNADAEDWIAFDSDGLIENTASGGDGSSNWFPRTDFLYTFEEVVGDTNFIMASSSYMVGFSPGNKNYLITPEVTIPAEGYVFRWSSSLLQTPRYADGYSVVVSPDASVDDIVANFTDVLFVQAQMVEETSWLEDFYPGIDYAGCSAPTVPDETDVCWFPQLYGDGTGGTAYRHAADHTLTEYLGSDPSNVQAYRGLLEPHSVDLSAYAGQTIRIAILHDSDDDFVMGVDDISVELLTSLAEYDFDELINFSPNPVVDVINLDFSSLIKSKTTVRIYDSNGRQVRDAVYQGAELQSINNISVSDLSTGLYTLQVEVDGLGLVGKSFMKH